MPALPRYAFGEVGVHTFLLFLPMGIGVRKSAGVQDVERDTQRPNRGSFTLDSAVIEKFRWLELGSASEALIGFLYITAASKVNESDGMGAGIDENVRWFNVTVDDS